MPLFGAAPALHRSLVNPRDANAMRVRGMKEQVHSIRIRSNVIVYTKHIRLRHFNIDDDLSLSLGQIRAVWPRISEKNFLRVSSYIMSVLNLVLTIFFSDDSIYALFFLLPKRSSLLVCRCSSRSEETRCSFAVTVFLFSPTYFCPPPLSLPFPLTPPLRFKPARSRPFSHTTIRFSSCTYHHPYLSKAECGLICTLFFAPVSTDPQSTISLYPNTHV